MTITTRYADGVVVLQLSGSLMLYDGDALLKDTVRARLDDGARQLLLDVRDVGTVDSAGLGVLVSSSLAAKQAGGTLRLLAPNQRLRTLIAATRLQSVLAICDGDGDIVPGVAGPA